MATIHYFKADRIRELIKWKMAYINVSWDKTIALSLTDDWRVTMTSNFSDVIKYLRIDVSTVADLLLERDEVKLIELKRVTETKYVDM